RGRESLNRIVAVLAEPFVIAFFLIDVGHRVVLDVAGDHALNLEFAGAEREHSRFLVEVPFEDIRYDIDQARMRGENETGPRGIERLGDMPRKSAVIADAGHEGDLSLEVNRNHEASPLPCLKLDPRWSTKTGKIGQESPSDSCVLPLR